MGRRKSGRGSTQEPAKTVALCLKGKSVSRAKRTGAEIGGRMAVVQSQDKKRKKGYLEKMGAKKFARRNWERLQAGKTGIPNV